jgi:hypothetical protein
VAGLEVDVVVADREIRHDPELRSCGVEEAGVDRNGRVSDDGGCPLDDVKEFGRLRPWAANDRLESIAEQFEAGVRDGLGDDYSLTLRQAAG